MVRAMFNGPVNRCSRIQATGPTTEDGGGDGCERAAADEGGPCV